MLRINNFIIGCAALALCSSAAQATDILLLKNGDRISGQIVKSQQGDTLSFQSHYGVELEIPFNQILAIQNEAGETLSVSNTSNEEMPAPIQESEAETTVAEVEPAAGAVEEPKDPAAYEWSGRVNLGASLDDGNSQKKAFTGDAEITGRNDKNRWIAGGDANFANDEGVETENDQSLYGEYNRFLSEKWFVGVRQEFEIDKIAELDLRSKTGPFAGYQFYEQDDLNLRVRFGANYIYEEFESGDKEEDAALAWALNYDQTFWDEVLTLFHNHELDTPVDPVDAFIFQSETGVRVPVGKHLVGTAQVDFDWDNEPAPGVQEEDTKYSVKLGYEW